MSPIHGANVTLISRTNVTESKMSPIGGRKVTDFWNDYHIPMQ